MLTESYGWFTEGFDTIGKTHQDVDFASPPGQHFPAPRQAQPALRPLNPQGIHHGPPEEMRQWYKAHWRKDEYYDWQIINVDCERPLKVTAAAQAAARGGKQR